MKIKITRYTVGPNTESVDVDVPALPRVGDHVSHDPSGISGYVKSVGWWWTEKKGAAPHIEVMLYRAGEQP